MSENKPIIKITNLKKSFGENINVLNGIDLEIFKGEIVAVIGPSGTGKSTMLRCINYLEVPDEGIITLNGSSIDASNYNKKDITEIRKHTAMVFQHYNLFKNMTVLENVMEALRLVHKINKKEAERIALDSLEMVGMLEKKDQYPSRLSGGQQQRVGIARAISVKPDILLLDEPTSSLDPELVAGVLSTIKKLATTGVTMIIVTHEINFAKETATRVLFMENGKIAEDGSPEEVLNNPNSSRLRDFLNINNK